MGIGEAKGWVWGAQGRSKGSKGEGPRSGECRPITVTHSDFAYIVFIALAAVVSDGFKESPTFENVPKSSAFLLHFVLLSGLVFHFHPYRLVYECVAEQTPTKNLDNMPLRCMSALSNTV